MYIYAAACHNNINYEHCHVVIRATFVAAVSSNDTLRGAATMAPCTLQDSTVIS